MGLYFSARKSHNMKKLLYTALLLFVALFSYADEKSLDKMAFNAAVVNNLFPQERVYLHFDNSAYYLGETMWFKAYVTEGDRKSVV